MGQFGPFEGKTLGQGLGGDAGDGVLRLARGEAGSRAGIDVGAEEFVAAVPPGRAGADAASVRTFTGHMMRKCAPSTRSPCSFR